MTPTAVELSPAARRAYEHLRMLAGPDQFCSPSVGLSPEDTAAAITVLDKAGLRGSEAGTGLRGVIALTGPSKEAAKVMEHLGVSIGDAEGIFARYRIFSRSSKWVSRS